MNPISEGRFTGTGKMLDTMASCERSTPLGRLENALNRLSNVAEGTVSAAMSLTGGWPQGANGPVDKAPQRAGMFGAIEDIADAVHRVCDRLDEANRAVVEQLP